MLAESVVRKECASLLERVRASDSHTCSNISIIFKVQLLEPPKEEKKQGKDMGGWVDDDIAPTKSYKARAESQSAKEENPEHHKMSHRGKSEPLRFLCSCFVIGHCFVALESRIETNPSHSSANLTKLGGELNVS
jgi:hypothetical protein